MGMFATRRRGGLHLVRGDGALPAGLAVTLPPHCEAIAEALTSGRTYVEACAVAGQRMADDGISVSEALVHLRETWQAASGTDPHYEGVTALVSGWTEATLGYLGNLTCADPLTGLANHAHLRTCVADMYRTRGEDLVNEWAFVVCELPATALDAPGAYEPALNLAALGDHVTTVFPDCGPSGRVGTRRLVTVVSRDDRLGRRLRLLRLLLNGDGVHDTVRDPDEVQGDADRVRVWVEALPHSEQAMSLLLDDLAR